MSSPESHASHLPQEAPEAARPPAPKVAVRTEPAPVERPVVMPPVDIFDSPEGLVLIADLPGVSPETLDLQVQDNKLTLFGRVAEPLPAEVAGAGRHEEFEHADYLRSFILSEEVDHERITARLANGVLELRLPRLPKTAPRKIQVSSE
jgi:HSP20 family molecular chaperone IbpA